MGSWSLLLDVTWLVTGGAGYIGAHVVHTLHAAGDTVAVLDNLSTGVTTRDARAASRWSRRTSATRPTVGAAIAGTG